MSSKQLANSKYRNWIKAGLGLKYVKEGLEPFCDDVVKQQHDDITNKVKQTQNLVAINCGLCDLRTLQPDHIQTRNKQCPLGQVNCNCQYPGGKITCPNNICGAIYDEIINFHASTPPAPFWKNTDAKLWCTDAWAVAKCFINAPGYTYKMTASEVDCVGLLHVFINNKDLQKHLHCAITGNDVFCKVRRHRNTIFYRETMEIEDANVIMYVDDMIALLQDDQELKSRKESRAAVQRLQQLKNEDFIITTSNEAEVKADLTALKELEKGIQDDLEFRTANESLNKSVNQNYTERKTDFQSMLINIYKQQLVKVFPLPLLPEENQTEIDDAYVPPLMTREIKRDGQTREMSISMDEIFKKGGKSIKHIYILGEAGSGKSTFCKSIVSQWCHAHRQIQLTGIENELFKEMKMFQFLFYISLRHYTDCRSIEMMLNKAYANSALPDILKRESDTCLILLDGLDEWTPLKQEASQFQTTGLPKRDLYKNYTIITTSRPWKFYTLRVKNSEVDLEIKLKGIDKQSRSLFTEKTLKILNDNFHKNKVAADFENDLKMTLLEISQVPMILQQLICLWFDEKLNKTSKCSIYSSLLDLFFEWASLKIETNLEDPDMIDLPTDADSNFALQKYLSNYAACCNNIRTVQILSRLAFETLFDIHKENSLAFTSSKLSQLQISNHVKLLCLKIGILSEDEGVSLFASRRQTSSFSFIHKTVQEYLAALHIAAEFEKLKQNSEIDELINDCLMHHVIKYLGTCKTVNDILDQSNVLIIVCGLEPQLTQPIVEYVYNVVEADKRAREYRSTLCLNACWEVDDILPRDIQKCVVSCIMEMNASAENINPRIHMGDIIISGNNHSEDVFKVLNTKIIIPDSVKSLFIKTPWTLYDESVIQFLLNCKMLKALRYESFSSKDKNMANACDGRIAELFRRNNLTLECVDLKRTDEQIVKSLIHCMPEMHRLVSIQVTSVKLSHDICNSFSAQLSQCTNLQQISIDIDCNVMDEHNIDLLRHERLTYVKFGFGAFHEAGFSTVNLVTCKLPVENVDVMKHIFDTLINACQLQHLGLYASSFLSTEETDTKYVTEYLGRLLPSLKNLTTLSLWHFTFSGNIFKRPSEMKKLHLIRLGGVTISLSVWQSLINSVFALAQSVLVDAYVLRFTGDEDDPTDLDTKALQYVKQKTECSDVTVNGSLYFHFLKKAKDS